MAPRGKVIKLTAPMDHPDNTERHPKVVFIFDRVMHYHQDLFRQLEARLKNRGIELHLLSGRSAEQEFGRSALDNQVITNERKFLLRDRRLGNHVFRLALGYLSMIRFLRPQVVVCPAHPGDLGHWSLVALKRILGFRLVAWQCGYEYNPGRAKRILLRAFVPGFDFHLAYHGNARRYALENGSPESQITVMHNTINEKRFTITRKEEAREKLNQRHPELGNRRIVLFIGAILKEKKIEEIFEAMAQLNDPSAVLVIVGDGPQLPALRKLAADRDDVLLVGQVIEDVGLYFDSAEVYVLPGTGGLGINEAMAHSLPIISGYADGSADDLVIDGENGYRLRDGGIDELKDKIALILNDPATAARMGAKSNEWITGRFSFQNFLAQVEECLVQQIGKIGKV